MARPAKFDDEMVLDAASAIVANDGPAALSVVAVAEHLRAPSGSIYHRFASRDLLAASLWLRAVERFQRDWLQALAGDGPHDAARRSARHIVSWSRDNLDDARLLLLHRADDLVAGEWPIELAARNRAQRRNVDNAIAMLCRQLGARSPADRVRVRFAVVDVPYAAVRGSLVQGHPPEPALEAIVDDAVAGVLAHFARKSG